GVCCRMWMRTRCERQRVAQLQGEERSLRPRGDEMAMQAQGAAVTPTQHITARQQPWWLIPSAPAGLVLLGIALYLLVLLHNIEARMAVLPQVRELLTNTNGRLETVSGQLEQVNADMKSIPPLLRQVNTNVSQIASPLKGVNANVQGTGPTLRRMEGRWAVTDQRLTAMQQKLEALRQPLERMEETTHRLRKVLPR